MKYISNVRKLFQVLLTDSKTGQLAYHSKSIEIFDNELARQTAVIGRIEKIEVNLEIKNKNEKFLMNKNISTPYHVAQHVSKWMSEKSALALVNDSTLWDMHRPLEDDCTLKLLTFTDSDPFHVNKAFWRTCSFLLGASIQNAFSEEIKVTLHSFPSPQISSGSFIYDAFISVKNWKPTSDELRCLSADMIKLCYNEFPIQRLTIDETLAKEIFSDNEFKINQIPNIAKNSEGKVTVYRVGTHIDISKGPMISNTSQLGRCSITAVHPVESDDGIQLYRFQGVALPKGLLLNHFAYKILEDRSSKLNMKPRLQKQESL